MTGEDSFVIKSLTNSQQSGCASCWHCLPVLSVVLDGGALQEGSMGHSSGPAPAAVKCHSMAEQVTIPCPAVWDIVFFQCMRHLTAACY